MIKIILGSTLGLFLLIVAILAFTVFNCFRKKTPAKKGLETELERMFPGQFQVLLRNLKMLDVMADPRQQAGCHRRNGRPGGTVFAGLAQGHGGSKL